MDRKLAQFLKGSPVEVASGGQPHGWSRRLATVLLSLGFFMAAFGAPQPASADEASTHSLLKEFQQKADSFLPKGRVFYVTRREVVEAPEALLSRIMETGAQHGIATESAREGIKALNEHIHENPVGAANTTTPEEVSSALMPVTIIIPNTSEWSEQEALSTFLSCAPDTICTPAPITLRQINRFTLYHELGHAFQPEGGFIPESGNATYTAQMGELHADIYAMVAMTRDEKSPSCARVWTNTRVTDTLAGILFGAGSREKTAEEAADKASEYNISQSLLKACDMLDGFLADPENRNRLLNAADEDILSIANIIFKEVYPNEATYAQNLEGLNLLGQVSPFSLQPTGHYMPSIAHAWVDARDDTLASSTPQIRKNLKDFLEGALKASKSLQRPMTTEERQLLPPLKKPKAP
ncbi:MAG TPA: hypothetical protein DCW68_02490 [Rhodospirillaceae bacterium]|nr:MAG: hypothetical protein A2018_05465 [Alphaproteobacteria bacterium GWF2_58_20]HAU28963.1 hypothetical protein [Rhodospirillaceae bacterium]